MRASLVLGNPGAGSDAATFEQQASARAEQNQVPY
jgi:hypothetical protein